MSDFPSNKVEALTMLFLEKQDLTNKSPKELADLYKNTYNIFKKELPSRSAKIMNKNDFGL